MIGTRCACTDHLSTSTRIQVKSAIRGPVSGDPPGHGREAARGRAGGEGTGIRGGDRGGDRKGVRGGDREGIRKGPAAGTEERAGADGPTGLPKRSWWAVVRRTAKEFQDDELSDRAAALTYYGVLSLFPAILVLVSMLGVVGQRATDKILDNIGDLAPGPARDILRGRGRPVGRQRRYGRSAGDRRPVAAVWSASGYVAAFIRTSNAVYDLPEGRPAWKVTPLRIALTLVLMVMLAASALIVVFTGPLAERAGTTIGLGDAAITMWNIAKWPVLLVLVTLMIALLYWAAPNVRGRGFRWVSPGGVLAMLIWLAASAGFAVYAANFGSYNKTYGALAGADRLPGLALAHQPRDPAGPRIRRGTLPRTRHHRGPLPDRRALRRTPRHPQVAAPPTGPTRGPRTGHGRTGHDEQDEQELRNPPPGRWRRGNAGPADADDGRLRVRGGGGHPRDARAVGGAAGALARPSPGRMAARGCPLPGRRRRRIGTRAVAEARPAPGGGVEGTVTRAVAEAERSPGRWRRRGLHPGGEGTVT